MVRACNENGKWKNTTLYRQIDGRRDRGRPTKTYMDNIMEDSLKAQGMDIREATDKARERSTWRLLVRASSSANALTEEKTENGTGFPTEFIHFPPIPKKLYFLPYFLHFSSVFVQFSLCVFA